MHATVLLSQRVGAEPPEPDRITIWNMDRVVIEDRDGNQLSCTPAPR